MNNLYRALMAIAAVLLAATAGSAQTQTAARRSPIWRSPPSYTTLDCSGGTCRQVPVTPTSCDPDDRKCEVREKMGGLIQDDMRPAKGLPRYRDRTPER
jgi:hypothetical protein